MRDPIALKTHYPAGPTLLDKAFDVVFTHEKGPGTSPLKHREVENSVKGLIVPHGALPIVGPAAAWGYKAIAEEGPTNPVYILVGQAQTSTQTGITTETFLMPYGEVRVDQHLARALIDKGNIALNNEVHTQESIIEVQLPYLQFAQRSKMESVKILPLLVNHETNFSELAVDIKEVLLDQNKQAVFIFITNLTTYGREFKYVPFSSNVPEQIAELDKKVIDTLTAYDKSAFDVVVEDSMIPLSGHAALKLFFSLFTEPQLTLEQYYLSGDLNGNYSNTVSYGTFVIR